MIDALIKRVSVTYKCYEMYSHQGKKVQLCQTLIMKNGEMKILSRVSISVTGVIYCALHWFPIS
jgi:hypothetical protein